MDQIMLIKSFRDSMYALVDAIDAHLDAIDNQMRRKTPENTSSIIITRDAIDAANNYLEMNHATRYHSFRLAESDHVSRRTRRSFYNIMREESEKTNTEYFF